eukprot:scaffold6271_cov171-Amphora_coffeaeformis.AAC.1
MDACDALYYDVTGFCDEKMRTIGVVVECYREGRDGTSPTATTRGSIQDSSFLSNRKHFGKPQRKSHLPILGTFPHSLDACLPWMMVVLWNKRKRRDFCDCVRLVRSGGSFFRAVVVLHHGRVVSRDFLFR